jgi:hypothetical protein
MSGGTREYAPGKMSLSRIVNPGYSKGVIASRQIVSIRDSGGAKDWIWL